MSDRIQVPNRKPVAGDRSLGGKAVFLLGLAVVCAGIVGCASQQHLQPADIRPLHYSTGNTTLERVNGLRHAIQEGGDGPVRVLVIHGMITREPRFSEELQAKLAERLGLERGTDSGQTELARGYEFTPSYGPQPFDGVSKLPPSQLRRTTWKGLDGSGRQVDKLVFYEMLWAPMRDQVKDTFIGCFERGDLRSSDSAACRPFSKSLPNADGRLAVNRALKESITLGGFADATLVLGPIGDVVRDDVTIALCVVASDFLQPAGDALSSAARKRCNAAAAARGQGQPAHAFGGPQRPKFFAMTHSLGGFLFLDAQNAFVAAQGEFDAVSQAPRVQVCTKDPQRCDEIEQADLLFAMTDQATVFMNANQVSLLALARLSSSGCRTPDGSRCPNPYLRGRSNGSEPWNKPTGMSRMTVFVAFNDTDDLLGFELPPFLADTDGSRYVNVSVRNPAFVLPGLFKDPSGTHTHQARNPAIIEAIAEGFAMGR